MSERLIRIVRRMELPPDATGSGWPRREAKQGYGYRGRVRLKVGSYGLFVGTRDDERPTESLRPGWRA